MYHNEDQILQNRMAATRYASDTLTAEVFRLFSEQPITGKFRQAKYRAVLRTDEESPSGSGIHWEILDKGDFLTKKVAEQFIVNMYNVAHPTSENPRDWFYSSYRRSKFIRLLNAELVI